LNTTVSVYPFSKARQLGGDDPNSSTGFEPFVTHFTRTALFGDATYSILIDGDSLWEKCHY